MAASYPLFDTGYTLWKGDVDTQLRQLLGVSLREIRVSERELLHHYYRGVSAFRVVEDMTMPVAAD
ncbi:MAG: hypothetical protein Q7R40_08275 [Phaeospirillum sp.]|nr:hypothetical protein [Phaeospirillum sp.]